jgi:hypothetical protein
MVAIILVNYNGAEDTIECIDSLSMIRDVEYEIIVVDNCSTDSSIERLKELQRKYTFTLLQATSNNGFSSGNNIGITYASNADYYLLLNNDTVVEPDFLNKLVNEFKYHSHCGAATSKILYNSKPDTIWYAGGSFNKRTARSEHYHFNEKNLMLDNVPEKVTFASGCCLCISKEVINKIGLLNEDFFLYEEDVDFCFRITEAGFDIIYVPSSVIYHKVSASTGYQSSMSQFYSVRNKYQLIRRYLKGSKKLMAYLYCTLQFLFRCIKKEQSFSYYKMGLRAFLRNETGRGNLYEGIIVKSNCSS